MKVLHVFKTYITESFGGVEQVIFQLCHNTSKDGIINKILTLSKNPYPPVVAKEEATIYRFKENLQVASTGFSLPAIRGFAKLVDECDIVHYHFPWPFADLMHLICRVKKPTIVTYHSDIVKQKKLFLLYQPIMKAFFNSVDIIVATSPNYTVTSKVLQQYTHKLKVISLGYDKPIFKKSIDQKMLDWKQKLGEDFFLFVGALRYYKGLHFLLDAVKNTNLKVVIVGDGDMKSQLLRLAKEYQLNNVTFLGAVSDDDKEALLRLCYTFVFPSHLRTEAFGMVLLEAAMYGKPMISAEIGTGSSYININNDTGLVVSPANPLALRKAMEQLRDNPDIVKVMGANAEKRYQQLFTAKKMSNDYCDLYYEIIAARASHS